MSLSTSQSWHTESLPVSLGPESWQQVTVDPEEVKSLDSNGAAEKSENNSSNSDIVHVEREEIPEGVGEAAAPAPALMTAVPRASPTTSLFVELGEEEAEAAPPEASELEQEGVLPPKPPAEPPAAPPIREEATGRQGALRVGPRPGDLEKASPLPEGKSLLLLGGRLPWPSSQWRLGWNWLCGRNRFSFSGFTVTCCQDSGPRRKKTRTSKVLGVLTESEWTAAGWTSTGHSGVRGLGQQGRGGPPGRA